MSMATQAMTTYFPSCVSPWLQAGLENERIQQVQDFCQEPIQVASNDDKYSQVVRSPPNQNAEAHLQDFEVWRQFSSAQTEMIVTKPGRRIFPGYRVKFSGLNPDSQYCVLMDVVNIDDHRYKFQNGEWIVSGRGEPKIPQKYYLHPKSPSSGRKLMNEIISFHKVKLTNSFAHSATEKFNVHSMHRYQLRVHIVRTDDVRMIKHEPMSTFAFPQTSFLTVTAYQNHKVTKLKIANNPFARGFRSDGGKTKNARRFSNEFPEYLHSDVTVASNKRLKVSIHQDNHFSASPGGYSSFQPSISPQATNFSATGITSHPTSAQYVSAHPGPYHYPGSAQGTEPAGFAYNQHSCEYGEVSPYSSSGDECTSYVSGEISPNQYSTQQTHSPGYYESDSGHYTYPAMSQEASYITANIPSPYSNHPLNYSPVPASLPNLPIVGDNFQVDQQHSYESNLSCDSNLVNAFSPTSCSTNVDSVNSYVSPVYSLPEVTYEQ